MIKSPSTLHITSICLKRKLQLRSGLNVSVLNLLSNLCSPISVDDLKKAITMTDPEIDYAQMDAYICWAFNVKSRADLETVEALEIKPLIQRLKRGNLKRVGKKP